MLQKILSIVGVIIIILSCTLYYFLNTSITESPEMGDYILVAKSNIPEGTVIKDLNTAVSLFTARKTAKSQVVEQAIKVNAYASTEGKSVFTKMGRLIAPSQYEITNKDLKNLIGLRTNTEIRKNQQIITPWLSKNEYVVDNDERLYAIQFEFIDAVAGDVQRGDYVDLWIYYPANESVAQGMSEKLIGPLQVYKTNRDEQEAAVTGKSYASAYEFSFTEDEIKFLSAKSREGIMFLTKWGRKPTEEEIIRKITGSEIASHPVINQNESIPSDNHETYSETYSESNGYTDQGVSD